MERKIYLHELPERIKPFISILMSQKIDEWENYNWDKVEFTMSIQDETITIRILSSQIGFCFNLDGSLIGIYNWKW